MALADIYRSPISGLSFSRSQIQRPLTEQDDPEKLPRALAEASTRVMLLSETGAAVTGDGLLFLDGPDYTPQAQDRQVYLGTHGTSTYVLAIVQAEHYPQIERAQWISLREAFTVLDDIEAELFVESQAIANWIRTEKFCPRCGSETRSATFGWGQRCMANDHELFPRTDPTRRFERTCTRCWQVSWKPESRWNPRYGVKSSRNPASRWGTWPTAAPSPGRCRVRSCSASPVKR